MLGRLTKRIALLLSLGALAVAGAYAAGCGGNDQPPAVDLSKDGSASSTPATEDTTESESAPVPGDDGGPDPGSDEGKGKGEGMEYDPGLDGASGPDPGSSEAQTSAGLESLKGKAGDGHHPAGYGG